MKGQTLQRRPSPPNTSNVGRNRVRPLTTRPPVNARRPAASAWKEQARAALAPPRETPAPREMPAMPLDVEMVSALRQPKLWDIREEPRSVSLWPREERLEPAARVKATSHRRELRHWELAEAIALVGIALGAILQLAQAVK